MKHIITLSALASLSIAASANAALIMELQPNPLGSDPATQDVELSGTPLASFDLWIVSIEADPGGGQGTVDRAQNVTGAFGANGLAVVSINDLENPSNTLILAENFTGTAGATDVDTNNDGTADDLTTFTNIMDAIGILEDTGDPAYGVDFGGTDFTPTGNSTDPLLVFRDGTTGDWYNVEPGGEVFDLSGNTVTGLFVGDPSVTTFGSVNPSAIPEPSSLALLGLASLALGARRRR